MVSFRNGWLRIASISRSKPALTWRNPSAIAMLARALSGTLIWHVLALWAKAHFQWAKPHSKKGCPAGGHQFTIWERSYRAILLDLTTSFLLLHYRNVQDGAG